MPGDPIISDDYDGQALDRYAYVHDNPLWPVETNGRCGVFCLFLLDGVFTVAAAAVLELVFAKVPILGDLFIIADGIACGPFGPLCAEEATSAVAGVRSGSIGKALEAFVLTYAEARALHEVGDALDLAKGGGLSGGAFTAAAFVSHGLGGGTFSLIQGGSFGFGYLFNQLLHQSKSG